MSDHELQSWLDHRIKLSDPMYDLIENLDDTFGWGARFEHMWKSRPDRPCGLLLSGPNGCGKHTAAAHMFRILNETHTVLLLDGPELCANGYVSAVKRLEFVCTHPNRDEQGNAYPWCLILEGMESCSFRQEFLTLLGQTLTAAWLQNMDAPSVFAILIDSREEEIPSVLRSRLRLCRMSLPNSRLRNAWLRKNSSDIVQIAVNFELLVSATENFTYAQLADAAQNLRDLLSGLPADQSFLPDEELREFLQSQKPAVTDDNALTSLAQSAQQFLAQMPELLKHMGTAVTVAAPLPAQETVSRTEQRVDAVSVPGQPSRESLENMDTKTLASDLLGAEFVTAHLSRHQASLQNT